MSKEDDKFITIRENPLYGYSNVLEKIQSSKIKYLVRRQEYPVGIYRLKKQLSDKHTKTLDEHVEVVSTRRILWLKLTNEDAKEILGTDGQPLYGTYLADLRKYWSRSFMAHDNVPYVWIMEIKYIKKPVQITLDTVL